jgi:hypothetical protein
VAISGSLLALNRHQENWLRYRNLKENLEREKMLFLTGSTEAYAGPEAFPTFVRNAEAIMAEERANWTQQASRRAEGPKDGAAADAARSEPPAPQSP